MTETYFILLPKFISKSDGLKYINNSKLKFAFYANNKVYSHLGEVIEAPENSTVMNGTDGIEDTQYPTPGHLFIKNGFLQYFKEII